MSLDIENLHHMKRGECPQQGGPQEQLLIQLSVASVEYPDTEEVHLEQNYRSTGSILNASLAIVTQGERSIINLQEVFFDMHFGR